MDFKELQVNDGILEKLKKNGIVTPTKVQEESIPILKKGADLIAQAQTGTGKTLAFMLPILEKIDVEKEYVQALVITPTRELAIQIANEAHKYASQDISILAAYGGCDIESQIRKLKNKIHFVIATPGRLLDHLKRKTINLEKVSMLVLDEADLMLDMGFLGEVRNIILKLPRKRQTMLFSATISKGVKILSQKFLHKPERVVVKSKEVALENIRQIMVKTSEENKFSALCSYLNDMNPFMAIIFCGTKDTVMLLNYELGKIGYKCDELHGEMSQRKRERVMKTFRKADLPILICTDIAARGLDIDGVTHVFNYDIPQNIDMYIHRIGRTGRAYKPGVSITFVTSDEEFKFSKIHNSIVGKIEKINFGNVEKELKDIRITNNKRLGDRNVYERDKRERWNANSKRSSRNFRTRNRKS